MGNPTTGRLELMWPSSGGPSNREEYDVEAGDFDRGTSVSVSIPNVDFPMDISFTVLDVDPPIRAEVHVDAIKSNVPRSLVILRLENNVCNIVAGCPLPEFQLQVLNVDDEPCDFLEEDLQPRATLCGPWNPELIRANEENPLFEFQAEQDCIFRAIPSNILIPTKCTSKHLRVKFSVDDGPARCELKLKVDPGPPHSLKAIAPSSVKSGAPIRIKTTLLDEFKNEIPANSFDWGNPDLQGFLEINDGPPLPLRSIPGMPAFETHFETEETYDIEGCVELRVPAESMTLRSESPARVTVIGTRETLEAERAHERVAKTKEKIAKVMNSLSASKRELEKLKKDLEDHRVKRDEVSRGASGNPESLEELARELFVHDSRIPGPVSP